MFGEKAFFFFIIFFIHTTGTRWTNPPSYFPFTFVVGRYVATRETLPGWDDDGKKTMAYPYLAHGTRRVVHDLSSERGILVIPNRTTAFGVSYCLHGFLSFRSLLPPLTFVPLTNVRNDRINWTVYQRSALTRRNCLHTTAVVFRSSRLQ